MYYAIKSEKETKNSTQGRESKRSDENSEIFTLICN
jgi:hypothetical protein